MGAHIMSKKMDTQSLIIGLLLGVTVMATIAATQQSNEVGRFQIMAAENSKAYIIDTSTGRVWSTSYFKNQDREAFYNLKIPQ